jgi:hypothetical protein
LLRCDEGLLGEPDGLLGKPEGLLGEPDGLLGKPKGLYVTITLCKSICRQFICSQSTSKAASTTVVMRSN